MSVAFSELTTIVDRIRAERGLDARLCHVAVTPAPPSGALVVESTDPGLLEALRAEIGANAGVRLRELPAREAALPECVVASSSVVDVRREPSHTSELRTQIICGDAVTPLKDDGEWMLARLDDGYVGWIRTWHLTEVDPQLASTWRTEATWRVAVNHAEVRQAPLWDALPVTDLVIGTAIVVDGASRRGWRRVRLLDGRTGFVESRAAARRPARRRVSREGLAATGLRFLGIPYIWGGTTPKGFDCSGLMQRIFRLHGLLIPRDADQQSRFGSALAIDPATHQTGDLVFFGKDDDRISHVGLVLPDGLFLHAYGQVRVGSLDPRHPLFDSRLTAIYRFARNPLATK